MHGDNPNRVALVTGVSTQNIAFKYSVGILVADKCQVNWLSIRELPIHTNLTGDRLNANVVG